MPSYKRTAYLLPAGIVLLGATIAIVVALVGTAAAAAIPAAVSSADTGSQDFRGARDFGLAPRPAAVSSADTGSQDFRGARDFGSAAGVGATPTISAPKITSALQPGQTVSAVVSPVARYDPAHEHLTPDNGSAPVGGPTSAVQHGQTDSMAASGNGYPPAPWAPAFGPTEAPQPGQTDSMAASGNGSAPVGGPTSWAPAYGPTEAPQPGQTGW